MKNYFDIKLWEGKLKINHKSNKVNDIIISSDKVDNLRQIHRLSNSTAVELIIINELMNSWSKLSSPIFISSWWNAMEYNRL